MNNKVNCLSPCPGRVTQLIKCYNYLSDFLAFLGGNFRRVLIFRRDGYPQFPGSFLDRVLPRHWPLSFFGCGRCDAASASTPKTTAKIPLGNLTPPALLLLLPLRSLEASLHCAVVVVVAAADGVVV